MEQNNNELKDNAVQLNSRNKINQMSGYGHNLINISKFGEFNSVPENKEIKTRDKNCNKNQEEKSTEQPDSSLKIPAEETINISETKDDAPLDMTEWSADYNLPK
ncbi:MAG: hypothetical protein HY096_04510 [Nitrospinae bacterium]|nr:hypothetical protein [Nitrospinota bacterium]